MGRKLAIALALCSILGAICVRIVAGRPNIVFILTDDQDIFLNGTGPMAKLRKYIGSQGATFSNAFVTTPLCCPSRSSILTGTYVHNHQTFNDSIDGNCSSNAWQKGPEQRAFITNLKKVGYTTFYAGKYLNQYGDDSVGGLGHVPPGWDDWNGLKGNSVYYNYSLSVNGKEEKHGDSYATDYLTDVINRKATRFLTQRKHDSDSPFFMMLSVPAPHHPYTPAPQYSQLFTSMSAPRTASFNKLGADKHWLIRQTKSPMSNESLIYLDETFRNRWRTLLSVDDMIEDIVTLLDKRQLLNNTYIIFASDHGFHLGQFSLPTNKRQLYEFDIRVPLMVRGPGVAPAQVKTELVVNIDWAPTFLDLAGVTPPQYMDGQSFKEALLGSSRGVVDRTDFLVEHTGEYTLSQPQCPQYNGQPMSFCFPDCVCEDSQNNTYLCVRRLSDTQNLIYCGLEDSELFIEAYDIAKDPHQLTNVASTMDVSVLESLEQSLATLASCSGTACHDVKHPNW
ncbi:N-acetylglucosamine-6-sulfatase-like [Watersipora subatra]|uniref:N-acetylglucosamine-6-sulfatase-like n=1 Tax=Watersipora subatra TaxID=2589382 RepID=UPI00355C3134